MNKSFSGKYWNILYKTTEKNDFVLKQLMCSLCIPEITAKIMINRGIADVNEAEHFLDAKLKNIMPPPSSLHDMDKGVTRLAEAILQNQKIFIFGDYDVDGITSTALLVHYLRKLGINPDYRIPHRIKDGYGLQSKIFEDAAKNGVNLLIVADSGTTAINEIDYGNQLGIDTIIIDHHMPSASLPNAVAVINPNRADQPHNGISRIHNMSAAGVVFMFLVALQKFLKTRSFFNRADSNNEPDLKEMLGTVALGTVCDVMEIRGINRAFVNFAIKNQKFTIGLKALAEASGIEHISSSDDFGFIIGPAINAAGRLGDTVSAIEMMLSSDKSEANRLAQTLITLNTQRKKLEKSIFDEATNIIEKYNLIENNAVFVYGRDWNKGIIGIIAGKLKDKFGKPVFVAAFDAQGIGTGSARSVPGISISEILHEAQEKKIIIKGGGHELAGGFSLNLSSVDIFVDFLNEKIKDIPQNGLNIDCIISSESDVAKLANEISILEPFGKGAENPTFGMEKMRIRSMGLTRDGNHMLICVSSLLGKIIECVLFNIRTKKHIVYSLESIGDNLIDIAFTVKYSKKFGVGIIIEDIRKSD